MTKRLITILTVFLFCVFASPLASPAAAYDPFNGVDCSNGEQAKSAICNSNGKDDPLTGTGGLIVNIANIVAFVAGVAAVVIVVLGGIRYITSDGDANNVKSARNTVLYALIGIAVIILSRTLIIFVLNRYK